MDPDLKKGLTITVFGFFGLILAAIIKTLHDNGVLINEFITGSISLADIMTVTIIPFLIVGVIVAILMD